MKRAGFLLGCAAGAALVLGTLAPASAAPFSIAPLSVSIGTVPYGDVVIRNTAAEEESFSVRAFAWSQDEYGHSQLSPATQLLAFPALFTLAPGDSQRIRVGRSFQTLSPSGESAYRLYITQLPPARLSAAAHGGVALQERVDIPLFDGTPLDGAPLPAIAGVHSGNGVLNVDLTNQGEVHTAPSPVEAIGYDAAGRRVWSGEKQAWYVLAHARSMVTIELPLQACRQITRLHLQWLAKTAAPAVADIGSGALSCR